MTHWTWPAGLTIVLLHGSWSPGSPSAELVAGQGGRPTGAVKLEAEQRSWCALGQIELRDRRRPPRDERGSQCASDLPTSHSASA